MDLNAGKENLKREIGVRALSLGILNITVGTGIFVIPAIIAENLGAAAIFAYLVCGLLIFLIALCFAEVGGKTNVSGGTYAYIEAAFGPYAGFIANNLFVFAACVVSDAAVATAMADTLKFYFPLLGNEMIRILFFVFIFGSFALLNIRSVKNGVRFVEFATLGKLIPLIVFVISGTAFISMHNLRWTFQPSIANIGSASLLLFFAFMGIETPITNGGEIKNPRRTVPLGIFFGTAAVLILYISIQLVTQGVLGDSLLKHKDSPLAAVAAIIAGRVGGTVIILVSIIAMLGNLGGEILAIPRILFAGARDGIMPKVFAKVHPKYFTPHVAVAVYALLGLLFSILGAFKQLAIISSATTLLIYLGVILATIKLRKKNMTGDEKSFRIPGGLIVPVLAICVIGWLLSKLTKQEVIGIVGFVLIFSLIYLLTVMGKKKNPQVGD